MSWDAKPETKNAFVSNASMKAKAGKWAEFVQDYKQRKDWNKMYDWLFDPDVDVKDLTRTQQRNKEELVAARALTPFPKEGGRKKTIKVKRAKKINQEKPCVIVCGNFIKENIGSHCYNSHFLSFL